MGLSNSKAKRAAAQHPPKAPPVLPPHVPINLVQFSNDCQLEVHRHGGEGSQIAIVPLSYASQPHSAIAANVRQYQVKSSDNSRVHFVVKKGKRPQQPQQKDVEEEQQLDVMAPSHIPKDEDVSPDREAEEAKEEQKPEEINEPEVNEKAFEEDDGREISLQRVAHAAVMEAQPAVAVGMKEESDSAEDYPEAEQQERAHSEDIISIQQNSVENAVEELHPEEAVEGCLKLSQSQVAEEQAKPAKEEEEEEEEEEEMASPQLVINSSASLVLDDSFDLGSIVEIADSHSSISSSIRPSAATSEDYQQMRDSDESLPLYAFRPSLELPLLQSPPEPEPELEFNPADAPVILESSEVTPKAPAPPVTPSSTRSSFRRSQLMQPSSSLS